jgi:hypothetical protein
MKTRVGKIARMPHVIREELNRRLANGVPGIELIVWLNAMPEVQKILAELFGGRAISNNNLSVWKQGGYADWVISRESRTELREIMAQGRSLDHAGAGKSGGGVVGYLGTLLAVELAQTIDRLHKTKNPEARMKIFRKLSMELSRLRFDHYREQRLELKRRQAAQLNKQIQANQP